MTETEKRLMSRVVLLEEKSLRDDERAWRRTKFEALVYGAILVIAIILFVAGSLS